MFLRIDARGPGSDEISYQIGNHPGRQLIRRESEVLGRLWFPTYEEEQSSVVLHVRSNIPPIPDRLSSSAIRYREWNRFAEWVDSFLGKVISDPTPPSPDESTPKFRVTLGVLPANVTHEDTLMDLFDRADLQLREPPGRESVFERWLQLKTAELSFSQLLRRLAVLIPPLFGSNGSRFHARGYARLLDRLRGTWFNVHPLKEFLVNRFLCLRESTFHRDGNRQEAISLRTDQKRFESRRSFARDVGRQMEDLISAPRRTDNSSFWILNARDGFLLPGLTPLFETFSPHLVEGRKDELNRCEQRVERLGREGELPTETNPRFHWCPAGFQHAELRDPGVILWLPRACELKDDVPRSMSNVLLSAYKPDRLLVWSHVVNDRVVPPSLSPHGSVDRKNAPALDAWTTLWKRRAEEEGYHARWQKVDPASSQSGAPDTSLIGTFRS